MGIGEPAKLMRIGGMIKQLLDEVARPRWTPRPAPAWPTSTNAPSRSWKPGCPRNSPQELHRIRLPFADGETPSEAELRVAQAQLVGWLEGVFHGLQAAMAAQQMANQQLAQRMAMRQLPPGTQVAPGIVINEQGEPERMAAPGQGSGTQAPAGRTRSPRATAGLGSTSRLGIGTRERSPWH